MEKAVKAVLFVSLFLMVGCAHIPFIGKASQPSETVTKPQLKEQQTIESNDFVEKGQIVDASRLQQGHNLAIIPFKAGVDVEAGEELDRAALMVVKGISDAFADDHSGKHAHFKVLTAEDSQAADLIVQGHITDMIKPSKVGRWVLLKKGKKLGVEGKMIDAQTGEAVVIFSDHAKTSIRKEDHAPLGYRIGQNIGRLILSGIK